MNIATLARLFIALVSVAAAPGIADAEIIILGSNAPGLPVGKVLQDGATLDVPSGARVRIMLSSGSTREIKGPLSQKVAALSDGKPADRSLWNDVTRLVTNTKKADESTVGAVRSVAPSSAGKKKRARGLAPSTVEAGFSWRHVPIDGANDGDVCVERGAHLQLVRSEPGRPIQVVVINRQSQARGDADFRVGSATADWPSGIGTEIGLYVVVRPDGTKRNFRLRPISPLPAADDTLRVLHGQRCLQQVEAWLRGLALASR